MCIRDRLEALGGIQWPCPDEDHPGAKFLHGRLWESDPVKQGMKAPFSAAVSYTHLRAHETVLDLVCRLLLEKQKYNRRILVHS